MSAILFMIFAGARALDMTIDHGVMSRGKTATDGESGMKFRVDSGGVALETVEAVMGASAEAALVETSEGVALESARARARVAQLEKALLDGILHKYQAVPPEPDQKEPQDRQQAALLEAEAALLESTEKTDEALYMMPAQCQCMSGPRGEYRVFSADSNCNGAGHGFGGRDGTGSRNDNCEAGNQQCYCKAIEYERPQHHYRGREDAKSRAQGDGKLMDSALGNGWRDEDRGGRRGSGLGGNDLAGRTDYAGQRDHLNRTRRAQEAMYDTPYTDSLKRDQRVADKAARARDDYMRRQEELDQEYGRDRRESRFRY